MSQDFNSLDDQSPLTYGDVKEICVWQSPSTTGLGITGLQLVYDDDTSTRIYGQRKGIKRKHHIDGSITEFRVTRDSRFVRYIEFVDASGVFKAGAESEQAGHPRGVDVQSGKLKGIKGSEGDVIYELEPVFAPEITVRQAE